MNRLLQKIVITIDHPEDSSGELKTEDCMAAQYDNWAVSALQYNDFPQVTGVNWFQ